MKYFQSPIFNLILTISYKIQLYTVGRLLSEGVVCMEKGILSLLTRNSCIICYTDSEQSTKKQTVLYRS